MKAPAVKSRVRFFFSPLGGSPENVRQAKVKTFPTNNSVMHGCVFMGVNVCVQVLEPFWQEVELTKRN